MAPYPPFRSRNPSGSPVRKPRGTSEQLCRVFAVEVQRRRSCGVYQCVPLDGVLGVEVLLKVHFLVGRIREGAGAVDGDGVGVGNDVAAV